MVSIILICYCHMFVCSQYSIYYILDLFTIYSAQPTNAIRYPLFLRHFHLPFKNSNNEVSGGKGAQSVSGSDCRMSPQFAAAGEIPDSPLIELTGAAPCKKLLSVSL